MNNNFEENLFNLFKKEPSFISEDGEILKDKIIDSAYKADKKLIEILIENKEIKKKFFGEIKGCWIFNINDFVTYIQDKNFLNDSYTKYKNKIGLNIDGRFLNERKEVSIVWPFKDCVLEGGMTKEDQKKKEIFFNEILAQDEIDKLFSPKVLTNWKKYTQKGQEEVKNIKRDGAGIIKENLIIKGNNLLALHTIKDQFQGKIKLIYIDPPYYFENNKTDDSFAYNSNFKLSTWLTFMKSRLILAKELLKDDGLIFIQINDLGHAYLKVLMDEIFDSDNFVNSICVKMSDLSGPKMAHLDKKFPKIKENILVYKKNNIKLNTITSVKEKWDFEYKNYLENFNLEDYKFVKNFDFNIDSLEKLNEKLKSIKITPLNDKIKELGVENLSEEQKNAKIYNFCIENSFRIFRTSNSSSIKKILDVVVKKYNQKIIAIKNPSDELALCITTYDKNSRDPRVQIVFSKDTLEVPMSDIWMNINTSGLHTEGGVKLENGKKPEKLINYIISSSTEEGDIVLDYHLGSGTTCAVAHKMNRQYIGIEQLDYKDNDSVIRLKKVIDGDKTGISKEIGWKGGGDFIYFELMKYNEGFIEKIKESKDTKSLLKTWEEMKDKAYFKHNFEMQEFEKDIEKFKKLELKEQKKILFNILDKNQLYVNYSEIDDKKFKVGEKDKKINKEFYGE